MRYVPADEVHALLDYPGLIEALWQAHRGTMPEAERVVRDEPGGGANRFVAQIGWRRDDLIAVKLVGVFPANLALVPPQPSVQGVVVVLDAGTGAARLAADGAAMTFRKTAADSGLGARLLARGDARTLLVVGAGGLAPHMIEAHRAARPSLERVLVWNRGFARAEALAAQARRGGVDARARADLDTAIGEADVISCVTMSREPLVRGALLKPGAHLDLVGAYLPDMREADDEAMRRARIFVDTRRDMETAGDLAGPVASGAIGWDAVEADLVDLCTGRHAGRGDAGEITVYKNVGGGHLDLFTARHLARRLDRADA